MQIHFESNRILNQIDIESNRKVSASSRSKIESKAIRFDSPGVPVILNAKRDIASAVIQCKQGRSPPQTNQASFQSVTYSYEYASSSPLAHTFGIGAERPTYK